MLSSSHLRSAAFSVAILALLFTANQALAQSTQPLRPIASDFSIEATDNQVTLSWTQSSNNTFLSSFNYLFSVETVNGVEASPVETVPQNGVFSGSYSSNNNLSPGVTYNLKVVASTESGGTTTNSETLEIGFTTKRVLEPPTGAQITFSAAPESVEVRWNNSPPSRVSNYIISILPDPAQGEASRVVNSPVGGAEIFTLSRGVSYTINIISSGSQLLTIRSEPYIINLPLNRGDEIPPEIASDTDVNIPAASATSALLVWEAATDLAGSFDDSSGTNIDNTRPNNNNISYETTITDITLGVANPITQSLMTGILNPEDDGTVLLSFSFNPSLELNHVYRASVRAIDDAGLRSAGTYTGIFPPVSLPIISDNRISLEDLSGTSVSLTWLAATEEIGTGPDLAGSNNNLAYELTITDASLSTLQTATTIQTIRTEALPPVNGSVTFALDRSNSVLIPGREYTIEIAAFNSLEQESASRYTTGRFNMALTMDVNNDDIEDSLVSSTGANTVLEYCGGSLTDDSDGDGIPNGTELKIGTDCRPAGASNNNFNDGGLKLGGLAAPTREHIVLSSEPTVVLVGHPQLIGAPPNTLYAVSISPDTGGSNPIIYLDATVESTPGSTLGGFNLDRTIVYTISVKLINELYLDSADYTIPLPLNRGDEIPPEIASDTDVNITAASATSVRLAWEAATDLAGSGTTTRPNNDNISYEISITDITLGVANPMTQSSVTGILNPEENSTEVSLAFNFNFEVGHVYEVSIIAIDDANLRSASAYTRTFPSVTRPVIASESAVVAENGTGTSMQLRWNSAYEITGSGGPLEGRNDNLEYELTIADMSNSPDPAATTVQTITTGALASQNGAVTFTLDRSNSVLIPGRNYVATIVAFNSSAQMSAQTYSSMFEMGASADDNTNGIEDSLENIITDINNYCGAGPDSDGDGISNAREVATGTDCRAPADAGGFNDSGLTLNGASELMLTLTRIGEANIADAYTVSNPVAGIGLTKIERGSLATVVCPSDNTGCVTTIRPLLAVADAEACTNLGGEPETDFIPAGISEILCQAQDEDNIYLPVGFSEVIWKVQDSSGNILRPSLSNNLRQLYYVAPEINVSPRKLYVELGEGGEINATSFVANVNVNFGEPSRYDGSFAGNIFELDVLDFMLTASTGEDITDPSASLEQASDSMSGVATSRYVYFISFRNPSDANAGALASLVLNTSGIRTIDLAGDTQLMIDRQDPNTYAYKFGNLKQEVEVIERIVSAPTILFTGPIGANLPHTLTIINNDFREQMILVSLFDSSSDMEVGEDIFSSISGLVNAGATSPISIATRSISSENLAMRIRIFAPEDEALGNPLYERYCYNNNGQFCNTPRSSSTPRDYSTSTSPSRTASVELISQFSHRPEGRYSANLVLDSNTSPEMKAMADTERFGDYGQFPSITFNADSLNRGNNTRGPFSPMIAVVIKLSESLPEASTSTSAAYMHKYINSQWQAFVEQDADGVEHGRLYSAKSTGGACPALVSPGDPSATSTSPGNDATNGDWTDIVDATQSILWYRTTRGSDGSENLDSLRGGEGYDCVLMWIADGGANDADGVRNGIVNDPSRIGAPASGSGSATGSGDDGGAVNTGLLFLLMLIAGASLIQRRKKSANSL